MSGPSPLLFQCVFYNVSYLCSFPDSYIILFDEDGSLTIFSWLCEGLQLGDRAVICNQESPGETWALFSCGKMLEQKKKKRKKNGCSLHELSGYNCYRKGLSGIFYLERF